MRDSSPSHRERELQVFRVQALACRFVKRE